MVETVPRGNLPEHLTTFVGRSDDVAEVERRLGSVRLVTLTGLGGVGKTRLALAVAGRLAPSYAGAAWFVDLSALDDETLVAAKAASALGVAPTDPARSAEDAVADRLRSRPTLVVLDNCEHVVDACAPLVETLLRRCPQAAFLCTSREPLGVPGEAIWPVASLDSDAALELFVDRARLRDPHFDLGDGRDVSAICERLDGIPLAIELAAARARTLDAEQIASRLDLALLSAGPRTAAERHRTMRATIDWSYDLLTGGERSVFASLSVFAGGFTMQAAERVCSVDGVRAGDVLDIVSRLVDRSLVVRDGGRYRVLETIRAYAAEKLAEPAAPAAVASHRVFRREGHYWTIGWDDSTFRLQDTKGLAYLRALLSKPGRELHVLELSGGTRESSDAGDVLDAEARAAYRRRLVELEQELEEARSWDDPARADRAQHEIEALTQQLAAAVGLGGRSRRAGSDAERARVSVTKAIRAAVERIGEQSHDLRRHLDRAVRTGVFCCYDPDDPTPWPP